MKDNSNSDALEDKSSKLLSKAKINPILWNKFFGINLIRKE